MAYYHGPTDDPLRDADNYDRDQCRWLAERPLCHACGEPIQSEVCYEANGHKYCYGCGEDCWNDIRRFYLADTMS
jgi:hypothetical protein